MEAPPEEREMDLLIPPAAGFREISSSNWKAPA
jgi:hypothetical protein